MTTLITSCRKLFTIGLSSLLFSHPFNGFHVAGSLSVFAGVLLNANADQRCRCGSRNPRLPPCAHAFVLL